MLLSTSRRNTRCTYGIFRQDTDYHWTKDSRETGQAVGDSHQSSYNQNQWETDVQVDLGIPFSEPMQPRLYYHKALIVSFSKTSLCTIVCYQYPEK